MSYAAWLASARKDRRRILKALGVVAGIIVAGQSGLACGSNSNPTSPPPAKEDLVVFVPGFMSQLYTAFSLYGEQVINAELKATAATVPVIGDRIAAQLPTIHLPIPAGGFVTFDSLEHQYAANGVAYVDLSSIPGFNTQQGVDANAAAIGAYLNGLSGKNVTLVSHSKGGLDTLQALLDNPGLWGTTVTGWVALQPPFAGSPVADDTPAPLSGPLLTAFGGDEQAMDDLKTAPRTQYMLDHAAAIAQLTAAVPVISCYTTFTTTPAQSFVNVAKQLAQQVFDANTLAQIAAIVAAHPLDPALAASEATTLVANRATQLAATAMTNVPLMGLTNAMMAEPNDGLVPEPSVALAGATIRHMTPDGDHAAAVMEVTPFKNFWTVSHRNDVVSGLVDEVRGMAGTGGAAMVGG